MIITVLADGALTCVRRLKASETGDYTFCFDNSFSQFSSKVVYFDLFIAGDDDDDVGDDAQFANLPDDTDYDIKLDDFKVTKTYEILILNISVVLQRLYEVVLKQIN